MEGDLRAEMKKHIQGALDDFAGPISGPMYRSLNKQIAELYLEEGDELSAIFHLTEALGATLRQRACFRFVRNNKNKSYRELLSDEDETIGLHIDLLKINGKWHDRLKGVLGRLNDMPPEWTVVQLTLGFDTMARLPMKPKNRKLGIHVTRLSCGTLSGDMSDIGEGGPPLSVFVPPLEVGEGNPTLMEAMKEVTDKLKKRFGIARQNVSCFDRECSMKIEAIVREMETWLSVWQCFIGGCIIDEDLQRSIKLDVDKLLLDYEFVDVAGGGDEENFEVFNTRVKTTKEPQHRGASLPNRTIKVLYLLATTPHISLKQLHLALFHLLLDKALVKYIGKGISHILQVYKTKLLSARRHPVILLVDEDLDIIPFEMMQILKDHPVSRMPSLHLLHALYHKHKDTTLRCGVNVRNGFFVINPSQDLVKTEATMKQLMSDIAPSWNGVLGSRPTNEEFKTALQNHSVFVYCGHGGGNQYLSENEVERTPVNAVVMLFGCASSQISKLGGNVEGDSLFNAYLMAGSPCVVGMLWSVLDGDTTKVSCGALKSWIGSMAMQNSGADDVGNVQEKFIRVLNISSPVEDHRDLFELHPVNAIQRKESELLRAVWHGRNSAELFYNKAALTVRGLPVFAGTTVIQ